MSNDFSEKEQPSMLYSYKSKSEHKCSYDFFSNGKNNLSLLNEPDFSTINPNDISFSHRLLSGFFSLERGGHRFIGKEAKVLIDIPSSAEILFISGYFPELFCQVEPLTLSVFIDDEFLDNAYLSEAGVFSLEKEINGINKPRRLATVRMVASRTYTPSNLNSSSSDSRKLSVILNEIGFLGSTQIDKDENVLKNEGMTTMSQPFLPYFHGTCVVCGTDTFFTLEKIQLFRETMICDNCNSSNRIRQLSRGLLKYLQSRGFTSETVVELSEELCEQNISIYDTDSIYSVAKLLRSKKQYITSDYFENVEHGVQLGERHFCQDLSKLTFHDDSFDVALTSDVFEHVRLYKEAISEIYRVLKPGGALIFTVPFDGSQFDHNIFVDVIDKTNSANDVFVQPAVYHGDPLQGSGALLYRIYGKQLFKELEKAGFVVSYERSSHPHLGIYDCDLFFCIKPTKEEIIIEPSTVNKDLNVRAQVNHLDKSCKWLNIELSSICNLRCRWCILDHEKPAQFLPLEMFEEVLKQIAAGELPELERIDLHNGGETLLHPKIDEALKLIVDYKPKFKKTIHIALLTNGTKLKDSTLKLLTQNSVVDEIRVSVDGGSPENFEYIRKGAKWSKVSSNVRRIYEGIKESNSKTKLGIICMVPPDKPVNVNWMDTEFRSVLDLAHSYELRHPHSWEGTLATDELPRAKPIQKNRNQLCKFLKNNLVVLADGNVTVCCADLNSRGVVGSLSGQRLAEIMEGDQRGRMIDLWQQGRFDEIPICSTCEGYYDQNDAADEITANSTNHDEANQSNKQTSEFTSKYASDNPIKKNEKVNPKALVEIAQIHVKQQNYFDAFLLLQKVLKENPFHISALEQNRILNEKIEARRNEKKWSSKKSVATLLSAESAIENQKLAEAKNKLTEILNVEPQNVEALNNLAVTNILEKQYESAAELLKSILMIDDTNEVALENYRYLVENNFVNENKEINWEYGFLEYCKGKGIEIGSGGKPLPRLNSLQVDLVDDYNGFKYHVDYLAAADDLSFAENGSFDYIIHSNMLEHLANPVKALIEWHRIIKPNGILYMIVPDKRLWINDRQRNVSYPQEWKYAFQENRSNSPSFPNNPNTHFFAYTPQALVDCFNKTESVSKLYEIVDLYTTSEKAVSQIVDEVNVFMPDGDHMMKNYLKIQEIQARNGEYKVGHSFHIVLRVVK